MTKTSPSEEEIIDDMPLGPAVYWSARFGRKGSPKDECIVVRSKTLDRLSKRDS